MNDITEELLALLKDAVDDTGVNLSTDAREVASYAAERAKHLATLVSDPEFTLAVRAERDAVALRAGIATVAQADAMEARMLGVLHGALSIAARFIAVA